MIHDLNTPKHKTIVVNGKTYYIGEVGDQIREEIGEISESRPLDDWLVIIRSQLEKYNEDFDVNTVIKEREVLSFIKAVSG